MNIRFSRNLFKFVVVGTRVLLGLIFFTSSMGKLTNAQFIVLSIFPGSLEVVLAPYGLGLWGRFVAWSQLIISLLLLSQRFATLGAIMLVPMLANILVITVSLEFKGTPYLVAFLLLLNLFLLIADYRKLKFFFSTMRANYQNILCAGAIHKLISYGSSASLAAWLVRPLVLKIVLLCMASLRSEF